jgi:hypothetical protein
MKKLVEKIWSADQLDREVSETIMEYKNEIIEYIAEELEYCWNEDKYEKLPREYDGHMGVIENDLIEIEFQLYHNDSEDRDKWYYSVFFYEKSIYEPGMYLDIEEEDTYEFSMAIEPSMIKQHIRECKLEELGI